MRQIPLKLVLVAFTIILADSAPNILMIVADDLGWADVSHHHGPIPTPVIDRLSAEGIRFSNYYVHFTCTPSRAALLTGKFSHNVGLVSHLLAHAPYGIERQHKLLSESLKERNYRTALVGKWHLGFAKRSFTPTARGFDSYFGFYGARVDYWTKEIETGPFDFHRNERGFYENSTHTTMLLTTEAERLLRDFKQTASKQPFFLYFAPAAAHAPLQPHPSHMGKCAHIENLTRRLFCGLVVGLDEAVGNITRTLHELNLLDETIIVFTSDNGGMPWSGGFNYPFRGAKRSAYEGGMRAVAWVRAPHIFSERGYTFDGLMHAADWAPTLLSIIDHNFTSATPKPLTRSSSTMAAGMFLENGMNMHNYLSHNLPPFRNELLLNHDPFLNMTVFRRGEYKLIAGFGGDHTLYWEPASSLPAPPEVTPDLRFATPVEAGTWFVSPRSNGSFIDRMFERIIDLAQPKNDPKLMDGRESLQVTRSQLTDLVFGTHHCQPFPTSWTACSPRVQLFNIVQDPQENHDLAAEQPELVRELLLRVRKHLERTDSSALSWLPGKSSVKPEAVQRIFDWRLSHYSGESSSLKASDPAHPDKLFIEPWLDETAHYSHPDVVAHALGTGELYNYPTHVLFRDGIIPASKFLAVIALAFLIVRFWPRRNAFRPQRTPVASAKKQQ